MSGWPATRGVGERTQQGSTSVNDLLPVVLDFYFMPGHRALSSCTTGK